MAINKKSNTSAPYYLQVSYESTQVRKHLCVAIILPAGIKERKSES